jgi:Ca2+-binding EF-hand superfamily protein
VVAAADRDRNNELSRSEFKALAYELGVPAKNNADINEIFGIIAKGESNKITIQQALAYFDQFKGADNKWSEAEFSKIVTRLSEGAPSVFSSLATNGVIKTAALAAQFTRVDTNKDGQLDKSEFEQLAANLGVDALKGAKFSAVAGNNNKISAAELLGYANGFGTTTNGVVTWSEAQFNAVVSDLTKKGG